MSELDPSLSFGYLVSSYDDLINLIQNINSINRNLPEQLKVITLMNEPFTRYDSARQGMIHSIVSLQSDYVK